MPVHGYTPGVQPFGGHGLPAREQLAAQLLAPGHQFSVLHIFDARHPSVRRSVYTSFIMGLAIKVTIASMLRALLLALALAPFALQAKPSRPQTQDEIFLAAHAAARAGDYDKLGKYEARLQGYLLQPHVEARQLVPRR